MENLIIANPIYDTAFKFLLEDNEIAIEFLSILLNEKIVRLEVSSENNLIPTKDGEIKALRLDYRANIEMADGTAKKVLIEIQKSGVLHHIRRFRNYLGRNYISIPDKNKTEEATNLESPSNEPPMEIVTIYFLGLPLPEFSAPVVQVKRQILDAITGEELKKNSNFVKLLTHEIYIVQLPRLEDRFRSELEQILDIFNQKYVIIMENGKPLLLNFTEGSKHPLVQRMAKRLQMAASDEKIRRQLEDEIEFEAFHEESIRFLENQREHERKEKLKERTEKLKEREEKLKERTEKEQEREEKLKEREEKERVIEENKRIVAENAKMMEMLQQLLERIDKLEKK